MTAYLSLVWWSAGVLLIIALFVDLYRFGVEPPETATAEPISDSEALLLAIIVIVAVWAGWGLLTDLLFTFGSGLLDGAIAIGVLALGVGVLFHGWGAYTSGHE